MRPLVGHKELRRDRTRIADSTGQREIPNHITSHEKSLKTERNCPGCSCCSGTGLAVVSRWWAIVLSITCSVNIYYYQYYYYYSPFFLFSLNTWFLSQSASSTLFFFPNSLSHSSGNHWECHKRLISTFLNWKCKTSWKYNCPWSDCSYCSLLSMFTSYHSTQCN